MEKIEGSTRCEVVGDLWGLSAKELCFFVGLRDEQISEVLETMEALSAGLSPRYAKHIQRCKETARRYGIELRKNEGKREMELDRDINILQTIILEHGSIWENPQKTKALFMDYYPNNRPLWHALLSCIDESIPVEIQGMEYCSRTDYLRFVKRLTNEYGYLEELAEKAVSAWIYAIGTRIEESSTESGKCSADMPIDEIELSVRSYNELKRAGINTVGDLTRRFSEDMMGVRNLGKKLLDEVLSKLKEMGFDLNNPNDFNTELNHPGRDKCDKLRVIRKKIADANGIDFEPAECHHAGPCLGTCPVCDSEIKYLDEELQKKKERGEEIVLSGLAAYEIKQSGCNTDSDVDPDVEIVDGGINEYETGEYPDNDTNEENVYGGIYKMFS